MIAKCILQDNHESLLQSVGGNFATLISTDGGVKSAASAVIPRSVIEHFRPPMEKFATHIIAMGDEEHYGPNRNGDSWPGEGLAKNAYTFVSNGHLFREHNNSHPDKAIGEIKYAAYDPQLGRVELLVWGDKEKAAKEWELMKQGKAISGSMSARVPWDECSICAKRAKTPREYCFTPDTLITMSDGTRKPISDIKIGDMVMSASGNPTKVTHLFRRDVAEEICHIKTSLNGRVIRTTKNHPVLALPADVAHFLGIDNGCSKNLTMNYLPCGSSRKEFSSIKIDPVFVDAGSLVPHDVVISPVLKNIDGSEADLDVKEASVCKEIHTGYIKTIQFEQYEGPVLNFETADHTYVAEGIAVHNCNHAAHYMGQYLPEHKKYAFVRNPHPKFFDYSFVEHPADSIAWGIEYDPNIAKAASVAWTSNICNGSDLARAMGVTFPDERSSDPSVLKFAAVEEEMRMVARTGFGTSPYQFLKGASDAVRDISDYEIVSLRRAKPYTVFYELAKAGCALPFESFCAYALNKSVNDVKSMPEVKKASLDILPLIYSLLRETTGLDDTISQYRDNVAACQDDATCGCDPGRPDVIDSLMSSADEKFNMGDDAVKNRITVTIIKFGSVKTSSIIPVCTEAEQYEAMKLASWYAAYQMQAVEDIARFHGPAFAEKVARHMVAQNVSSIAL